MTKKEKIKWTLIDVVTGLLMVYMCICLMLVSSDEIFSASGRTKTC